jgi:hypothetical protein
MAPMEIGEIVHKMVVYAGGPRLFRQKCDEIAAKAYEGFVLG